MLPEKLKALFKEMRKEAVNDLVFTDINGGLLKYNAIQSSFNSGFIALGLPWRSTHICRHTFATMALMGTKNLSAVQASLGHAEIKMTQKYAKAVALLSSDVGEKASSILFNTAKQKACFTCLKNHAKFTHKPVFRRKVLSKFNS